MRRRCLYKNYGRRFISVAPTSTQWVGVGTDATYNVNSNTDWKLI